MVKLSKIFAVIGMVANSLISFLQAVQYNNTEFFNIFLVTAIIQTVLSVVMGVLVLVLVNDYTSKNVLITLGVFSIFFLNLPCAIFLFIQSGRTFSSYRNFKVEPKPSSYLFINQKIISTKPFKNSKGQDVPIGTIMNIVGIDNYIVAAEYVDDYGITRDVKLYEPSKQFEIYRG